MIYKFPLSSNTWGSDEYEAIQNVIKSGIFTMGELVRKFEKNFAKYIGTSYCVMVNSGSSANLLMTAALFYTKNPKIKLKRGDEVIVPAVSWSTTYYPLYQYGLKIKFVDIDLHTLNYDLNQLENAVTKKTRMIVAVNLLGNPNDFARIHQIINGKEIILIEDNCESLGATFKGKQAGSFGEMGSYSSFFSHHICTMEGGMIVTNNEELYHIMLSLRAHGWTRDLPKHNHVCGEKKDNIFEESFRFVLPGFNLRPLELEGAIGVKQLERLPHIISERRKNGRLLQNTMKEHPDIIIQKEIGESSWFGFSLVIKKKSKLTRKILLKKLNQSGFETRPIVTGNFAKSEVVKYFNSEVYETLTNADQIDQMGLFIGNNPYPMDEAIKELKKIL
jgi:CDP-4-dehydro-6-deoxyglucose reductase, E1